MADFASLFSEKADESLAGAASEFVNGRYNNCVNRAYYACFQAAIYALAQAGVRPTGAGSWGHDFVQAQFIGQLINQRKLYPTELRGTLLRNMTLRHEAAYGTHAVNQTEASRALGRSRQFVDAILVRE